jgi:hypothetical protein
MRLAWTGRHASLWIYFFGPYREPAFVLKTFLASALTQPPTDPMANKIEDFTLDMIEKARENEVALSALGPAQQVKFINSKIRHNDAVFAIVPSDDAPHQGALYVITGAPVLDGSGFDLKVVETDGSSKNEKPVVLQRTLRLTAFFVASYMDARFLDIAFGDSAASRHHRREQQNDGGKQAVENMRQAATPYGRAYIAANPQHVRSVVH